MTDLYAQEIRRLARLARSGRVLENPQCEISLSNPLCGDQVAVLASRDGGDQAAVGYQGRGCMIMLASCARMAELVESNPDRGQLAVLVAEIEAMFSSDIPECMKEFSPVQAHRSRHECALLPFRALGQALVKLAD